ncbi:MAG: CsbD family protein [Propionivibrio sp.]
MRNGALEDGSGFKIPSNSTMRRMQMNSDTIAGNWKQLKGKAKEQWGDLTDDDLTVIEGKRDVLAGRIQERYGITRDEADKRVKEWERTLD